MNKFTLILLLICCNASVFGQNDFSSDDLQTDAKMLWRALNELHPGLYRHTDTTTLEKAYDKLLGEFSTGRNAEEAFLSLSAFIAKVKCGHTYLNPFNQKNKIVASLFTNNVLLPFTFVIIDKQIVIDKPLHDALSKNSIVTHINGIEVASIIDSLTWYIKADGNRTPKRIKDLEVHLTSKYEYFDYYFPLIYGFQDSVELILKNQRQTTIPLLTKKERDTACANRYPTLNASNYDDLWSQEFDENYALLKLGTFVTWRLSFDWKEYLDTFFMELTSRGTQNLIIDVRGNEGGLTDVTDYLIQKIANKQGETVFRKPHIAYKKVSDDLRPYVSTWSKRFYNTAIWTRRLDDTHRTIKFSANKPQRIKANKKAFGGKTYLMINESNSSATFILAEVCKKNNYATLVGTETGGTKKGITAGQIFFLTLPNTKIEVDIPLIGRYPRVELPDEGVQPDIRIEQTLSGYTQNRDEQFEKVLELLDER